jgi:hypothetical protein
MIWLLTHPITPLPTDKKTEKERQLDDTRGGKGVGEEPNHTTARKPGNLNNSIFSELTDLIEVPLFWRLLLVHRDPDWLQLGHLLLHHPNHHQTINVVRSEQITP